MHRDLPRAITRKDGLLEPTEATKVPTGMHRENRQKFLRQLFASHPELESENSVVLFKGAPSLNFFETDVNFYPHQEATFMYLFGVNEADVYALIELKSGKAIIVTPRLDPAYKMWMVVPDPDFFKSNYDIDDSIYEDELQAYLEKLETKCIYLPYGQNAAYSKPTDVANFDWLSKFKVDKEIAYPVVVQCRFGKSESEMKVLRQAYYHTLQAHQHIMQSARVGTYENQIEAIFQFEAQSRLGSKFLTAMPVVSSGANLHKLEYHENDKRIEDNTLVLCDLGIKYNGFCADVTNTFPINGKFSKLQREVYDLLVGGVKLGKDILKPSTSVESLHNEILGYITKGLMNMGIITKNENGIIQQFMPHLSIIPSGHGETEVGYDTRTVKALEKNDRKATNLTYMWPKLKTSSVVTVSVGVYFDPELLPLMEDIVDIGKFTQYAAEVGGARIERQFVITETGAEELTPSPLTADEIEALMKRSA
eukprot:CAMPEP_0176419172 /NCGR_PEP_ID=MMETSP0127-20121128/7896_1 /TAXON_ID=938130 /ORGANISM="Platyophrya macrostoma, Strain WH" /LENGTH=479 /DNA_ID=CAMNT_0017799613 /DNA_START=19 /DNA_END=1458 /DNA_ORIENTATION=+